jgi:hypothetical protein
MSIRPVFSQILSRLSGRAIHVLKYLEKAVHPRWPMTFEVAKHAVGVMVLLLTVVLLLTPVPLSNVAPAMVISLISLALTRRLPTRQLLRMSSKTDCCFPLLFLPRLY